MQSALENLDEAADMVLQCLDNLSKQADVNTVLISIRCLQDLSIAYPQLIQDHQVQSVWKTLCDVGNSNLIQLNQQAPGARSKPPGPTGRRQTKVHAPPSPPVSAAVANSYREMVCAVLACLGRWLTIPQARLDSQASIGSVMEFVTSCATLEYPLPKPGFPVYITTSPSLCPLYLYLSISLPPSPLISLFLSPFYIYLFIRHL